MMGLKSYNSNIKQPPSYSFLSSQRTSNLTLSVSQDFSSNQPSTTALHTPGVGYYKDQSLSIRNAAPKATIGKAERMYTLNS